MEMAIFTCAIWNSRERCDKKGAGRVGLLQIKDCAVLHGKTKKM